MEELKIGKYKKVLIFSPHPDDDVIGMGGSIYKLGLENYITVAYQTAGYRAVKDDALWKDIREEDKNFLKTLTRRLEAYSSLFSLGVNEVKFLDLPFYSRPEKTCNEEDYYKVWELVDSIKPDVVFVAGDYSDPHRTHQVCTELVLKVIDSLERDIEVYYYYSAWETGKPDFYVPLSEYELSLKVNSIILHKSQLIAMFPAGNKAFWEVSKSRSLDLGRTLGCYAAEGFKKR